MTTAVVFPGQGSQTPGAGQPWRDHEAWAVVAEAEARSGLELEHLLISAESSELAGTRASQLSVLAVSLVFWKALEPTLTEPPAAFAGHSLGQITALVASGVLDISEGLRLAEARAEATARAQRARPGGLVALLGCDETTAAKACQAVPGPAWVANVNARDQVVVGGPEEVLDHLADAAVQLGARRARRLPVDGAFHTPMMDPAAAELSPTLERISFSEPSAPVVTNHDGRAVRSAAGWPERLSTHLTAPVRWGDVTATLVRGGVRRIVEVGPGRTLTGLARRAHPDLECWGVSTPGDLNSVATGAGR